MTIESDIKQTKPFQNPLEKTFVNIVYTNNWFYSKQHHVLKEYKITNQQYNVLRILKGRNGEPITINGIIERMLDKMSNASRLVDKLVQRGFVKRTYREDDRRACNVIITDEGKVVLEEITQDLKKVYNDITHISEEEITQLNNLLDKLRQP